jgi:DNA-binding NarL/FixJ family response regulator
MWREAVARDLSEAGFDVVGTAADGEQALRRLPAVRPDVVVLDLQMPHVDGVAATRRVVSDYPDCHVLVLTASGEQADVLVWCSASTGGWPRTRRWTPHRTRRRG